jgi:hypothetical protein
MCVRGWKCGLCGLFVVFLAGLSFGVAVVIACSAEACRDLYIGGLVAGFLSCIGLLITCWVAIHYPLHTTPPIASLPDELDPDIQVQIATLSPALHPKPT